MSYCRTCGINPPHHWAGCPEDVHAVGMPVELPPAVATGPVRSAR